MQQYHRIKKSNRPQYIDIITAFSQHKTWFSISDPFYLSLVLYFIPLGFHYQFYDRLNNSLVSPFDNLLLIN